MRRLTSLIGSVALPLLLGGAGCHSYKYVDVDVSFDLAMDNADIRSISVCEIIVSGADTGRFPLDHCPNHILTDDPHHVGKFEFSTFADSGTLNFELKAYTGMNYTPQCQIAEGMTAVPVTSLSMLSGTLMASKGTLTGCFGNVTPPTDGGP
jgi:hypothetical protein